MNKVQEETVQVSEARKAPYPVILNLTQMLRTNKALTDAKLHPELDKALSEAKYYGDKAVTMLRRMLLHIGDISRQHNILKKAGIQSSKGGAGERANFRSIMRWWEKTEPQYFYKHLKIMTEFTVLENLIYDQIRTDRMKGTIKGKERMNFDVDKIAEYFANEIRTSKNPLIARHLPKYTSGKFRATNGKKRAKQSFTLTKEKRSRDFINILCDKLSWSLHDYKQYRKKQHTPEQLFSSGEIASLSEDLLMKMFDRMTASQRFRVAHMIAEKDGLGHLQPKKKWEKIGIAYIKWENQQSKIAEKIRTTTDTVQKEKLVKDFKVKATGLQTLDILSKMLTGIDTDDQINNTYQALLESMDLVGNIFPIIDGSGSMNHTIGDPQWTFWGAKEPYDNKYGNIRLFDVAAAMAIAFSTRNPNPDFKNTFGWFSNTFGIVGESKYVNTAPNSFVTGNEFTGKGDGMPTISDTYTFTDNLMRITRSRTSYIGGTNIGAVIEYFVNLHKRINMSVEQLPQALLFITDNEGNVGLPPKDFMLLANSIGWYPLVIFWSIKYNSMTQYKGIPNCLFIGGFNEGVLSQILRGIKNGTVMPENELWSINDDKRYSLLK